MHICEIRISKALKNTNDISDAKFVFKGFDLTEI